MKFLHLQIGQQFEFRGQHYTKVSPLIASNNSDGKQKMVPRAALVIVAESKDTIAQSQSQKQPPAQTILERYHQTAIAELKSLGDDEAKLGAASARLEALRAELEKAIQQT